MSSLHAASSAKADRMYSRCFISSICWDSEVEICYFSVFVGAVIHISRHISRRVAAGGVATLEERGSRDNGVEHFGAIADGGQPVGAHVPPR